MEKKTIMINCNILNKEDLDQVCRCCLSKDQTSQTFNIFLLKYEGMFFSNIMNSLLDIEVNINDEMPKKICDQCVIKIVQFYNFHMIYNASKVILKTLISTFNVRKVKLGDPGKSVDGLNIATKELCDNGLINKTSNTASAVDLDSSDCVDENLLEEDSVTKNTTNDSFVLLPSDTEQHVEDEKSNSDIITNIVSDDHNYYKNDLTYKSNISPATDIKNSDYMADNSLDKYCVTENTTNDSFTGQNNEKDVKDGGNLKNMQNPTRNLWQCNICFTKVRTSNIRRHMIKHLGIKPYICKYCGRRFSQRSALVIHRKIHMDKNRNKCSICLAKLSSPGNLKRHMKMHTGEKPYVCDFCGKGFIQQVTLEKHRRVHTGEKPFLCTYCGKTFSSAKVHKFHLQRHEDENSTGMTFPCSLCNKALSTKGALEKHVTVVHGEKRFLCSECGKSCYSQAALLSHSRVHTGDRPYICDLCGKSFAHTVGLKTHMLIHTGYRAFTCEICLRAFKQRPHLHRHMKTHTGEKPYSCQFCNRPFTDKGNLNVHIRIHTGETPYVCDLCPRGFHDSSSLKKHKKQHVPDIKDEISENVQEENL